MSTSSQAYRADTIAIVIFVTLLVAYMAIVLRITARLSSPPRRIAPAPPVPLRTISVTDLVVVVVAAERQA